MRPLTPRMVDALARARDARLTGGLTSMMDRERNGLCDRGLLHRAGAPPGSYGWAASDLGMTIAAEVCPPPDLPTLRAALAERRREAGAKVADAEKRLATAVATMRAALDEPPTTWQQADVLSAQWTMALRSVHEARADLDALPPLSSLDEVAP